MLTNLSQVLKYFEGNSTKGGQCMGCGSCGPKKTKKAPAKKTKKAVKK